jgi:hypothetical protein
MRFMIHWAVHSDKRKEVLRDFAAMELADYQASTGPEVTLIERWHDLSNMTGVLIAEAESAEALAKAFIAWHAICDFEIMPALTDAEAHAVAREMMGVD